MAQDKVAFYIRRSIFQDNQGYAAVAGKENGGAVALKGLGVSVFEDVQFIENAACMGPYEPLYPYNPYTVLHTYRSLRTLLARAPKDLYIF